jgi:peptidoglycan/LPS O-acetylase OafA/YrhL
MYVFHPLISHYLGLPCLLAIEGGREPAMRIAVAYMVVCGTLTFLVAFASYQLIERHFLALKCWFVPRHMEPIVQQRRVAG